MKTIISGSSIIGDRKSQQDEYYFNSEKGQVVVCDGMGGTSDGGRAANCAVRQVKRFFERNEYTEKDIQEKLAKLAENINQEIIEMTDADGNAVNSGTTIVLAVIFENRMYMMAIGDSRIYLIRNEEIYVITREHNYKLQLDEKLKRNMIDLKEYEKQIKNGEVLISYLGVPKLQLMDISSEPFQMQDEDIILLCSDGVYKALTNQQILAVVMENHYDADACALELLNAAKRLSRKNLDNSTAIVMKYKA